VAIGDALVGVERRAATSWLGSLLFRAGSPRVVGLAGGGLGAQHTADRLFGRIESCPPVWCITDGLEPTVVRRWQAVAHLAGGADVALGERLFAVGALRWQLAPDPELMLSGGVRVLLRSRSVTLPELPRRGAPGQAGAPEFETALGRDVRVIDAQGARHSGRLVGSTATTIIIRRRGEEIVHTLADVRRVETAPHYARNLSIVAAVVGFFGGWLGSCGQGDEDDCWPELGLMVAGIGAGAGLGIGAMMNSTTRRVLYEHPAGAPVVRSGPWSRPGQVGASVTTRW
jgi:hypothetical protein